MRNRRNSVALFFVFFGHFVCVCVWVCVLVSIQMASRARRHVNVHLVETLLQSSHREGYLQVYVWKRFLDETHDSSIPPTPLRWLIKPSRLLKSSIFHQLFSVILHLIKNCLSFRVFFFVMKWLPSIPSYFQCKWWIFVRFYFRFLFVHNSCNIWLGYNFLIQVLKQFRSFPKS